MKLRVIDLVQPVTDDIDPEARFDVNDLDVAVATSLRAALDSLQTNPTAHFGQFECEYLINFVEGARSSHKSIRTILRQGVTESTAVDSLVIARLQLETLYNFCFLHKSRENLQLFLKNGWKKQYIRFLLGRAERKHLPRAASFYLNTGPLAMESLRIASFVSEAEKAWIDFEELGEAAAPPMKVVISKFPTPMGVIESTRGAVQAMLKRFVPGVPIPL